MKLIITDLDNTLLRSDKSISEYTVKVFEKCRTQGYLIAFATARAENAMARFVEEIKPHIIVSNGGATINVEGKIIYRNLMKQDDVATIVKMCRQFTNDTGLITVECDEGYFCNFVPSDPDRYAAFTYSDFKNFRAPAYKITSELENDEWVEEISRTCPNCTVINFTGEKWRRFAAKNSEKETALRILADYIGIDMIDIIAFGDDTNDLGMLRLSGTAVAVSNAIDEVKVISDYIADSNDRDGVAKFLENAILT